MAAHFYSHLKLHVRNSTPQLRCRPCNAHRLIPVRSRTRRLAGSAITAAAGGLPDVADWANILADSPPLPALVLVPVIGLAAYFFYRYSQLEYITASMLTRHVPRDGNGAKVIQIGGGSKELYYYPKDTIQVTIVGEDVNKGLLEQAGIQAAVPTVARQQLPSDLNFAAGSSVDAVVCLRAASSMNAAVLGQFLSEASRVLKPGRPLIFIEKGSSSLLKFFKQRTDEWEQVEYDIALDNLQYEHTVGVAYKSKRYVATVPRAPAAKPATPKEVAPKPPKTKGFS